MSLPHSSVGTNPLPKLRDKETLLQQTYLEAYHQNYESVQRWTRWKEDHERVKTTLSTLPDRLSHEVVIPFGSKALMKAKLVHTNEVLTCIGSSWFVKQTAKQGMAMCERRIKQSDEMLDKLESERTLLSNRQTLPKLEEAFPSDNTKEIVEEYSEEREAEWRFQHRKREIEFRRELSELKKKQVEQPPLQTEEDIFRRLDELELEEELNDELERLHAEYEADYENDEEEEEGEISDDKDDSSQNEGKDLENESSSIEGSGVEHIYSERKNFKESSNLQGLVSPVNEIENVLCNSSSKKLQKTEFDSSKHGKSLNVPCNTPFCTDGWGKNSFVEMQTVQKGRRISFADQAPTTSQSFSDDSVVEENIYIRFLHSENAPSSSPNRATLAKISDEPPMYHTPADIFDIHKLRANSQPKSILKKSSSFPEKIKERDVSSSIPTSASFGSSLGLHFSDSEEEDDILSEQPLKELIHVPPVLCDVRESLASTTQSSGQEPSQRPMSRFKLAKQKSKK